MSHDSTDPRLRDRALAHMLPLVPRRLVRHFSKPYIAGSELDDAIELVSGLADSGLATTLDVLGESARRRHETECTTREYTLAIDRLAAMDDHDVANVSVKLTALGLSFDEQLAAENLRAIVDAASKVGGFVRIDMEDSPYTDATLDIFEALQQDGCDNVGVVIQSYLKRSAADVERLAAMNARVRMVKGIYVEPGGIAYRDMDAINTSYVELSRTLIEAGCHVAFATHDELLVDAALELIDEHGLNADQYEFQMLLGVTEDLRDKITAAGHPMRIYVPFGQQWYEYSVRRLRENPRIAGYVAGSMLRGLWPSSGNRSDTLADAGTDDAPDADMAVAADSSRALS